MSVCHPPEGELLPTDEVPAQTAASSSPTQPRTRRRIALVGMPNTGKSTLFNQLTGSNARVGNWPGLTVSLRSSRWLLKDRIVELVDLPGFYNFFGGTEDERIAQRFMAMNPVDKVILVLSATQLDRHLATALALKKLGAPLIVCINLADEAKRHGTRIDTAALQTALGAPVYLISAKHGQGLQALKQGVADSFSNASSDALWQLDLAQIQDATLPLDEANLLFEKTVTVPVHTSPTTTAKLDRYFLNLWLGLPLLACVLFGLFILTFQIGAPLQDFLKNLADQFRVGVLNDLLVGAPVWVRGILLDGVWGGTALVMSFAPMIFIFFVLLALVEDAGYLVRAAFLMDGLMSRIGLDGRGFAMQIMGFGCNVPAILGTRSIRDPVVRRLTILTLPFALCQARLQIFLFMSAALFTPVVAPWALAALYGVSTLAGVLTALVFGRTAQASHEPLIMELPPYRMPKMRFIFWRAWGEVMDFLRLATRWIVFGVILVWLLTHLPDEKHNLAIMMSDFLAPVLQPIGVRAEMSIALLFGFVAKEIVLGALAASTGLSGDALAHHLVAGLDWVSGFSFMLFTLLYVPCLSTVAALRRELGSRTWATISVLWSLVLAWLVAFAFYQGARALGF